MPEPRREEHAAAKDRREPKFAFGVKKVNDAGFHCCGKPVGCTVTDEGCAYLRHPWKVAHRV